MAKFQRTGTAGAAAGAMAGSLAGGAASGPGSWDQAIGTGTGVLVGQAPVSKGLPMHMAVAVSPREVYVLSVHAFGTGGLLPLAKIDRDKLGVEVHLRASVRTVILEDTETGQQL